MTSPEALGPLNGRRILIVEDEMMIAMLIEDILIDMGCQIVGPATSVTEALNIASSETFDAALLDVHLGEEIVYPVADALTQSGVPFVFVTGHGQDGFVDRYRHHPLITKPVFRRTFADKVVAALSL